MLKPTLALFRRQLPGAGPGRRAPHAARSAGRLSRAGQMRGAAARPTLSRGARHHLVHDGAHAPPVALHAVPGLQQHLGRDVVGRAHRREGLRERAASRPTDADGAGAGRQQHDPLDTYIASGLDVKQPGMWDPINIHRHVLKVLFKESNSNRQERKRARSAAAHQLPAVGLPVRQLLAARLLAAGCQAAPPAAQQARMAQGGTCPVGKNIATMS
jgi:hypothetical protein